MGEERAENRPVAWDGDGSEAIPRGVGVACVLASCVGGGCRASRLVRLSRLLAPSAKLGRRELESAAVASQSFEQIQPTTYAADLVVTFGGEQPRVAVIVDVQRAVSKEKRRSWPLYVAHLWARYGCPVFLLVLAPGVRVARWCAKPISLGHPGMVLVPIVAGPESVPRIGGRDEAMQNPELAVVSAVVHAAAADAYEVALLAVEALLSREGDSSYLYYDLILSALGAEDAKRLEDTMMQERQFASRHLQRAYSDGVKTGAEQGYEKGIEQGYEQGIERGRADDIVKVLAVRGLEVPAVLERRIRDCHDLATLDRWLELAVTARSVDELLA